MLRSPFLKSLKYLEIEEKILNSGALIAAIGVFLPWFGGEWFGRPEVWRGFQFYTGFIGILVFLGQLFVLSLTLLPLLGYPLVRPFLRELLRLIVGAESVLLIVLVLSILTNISFDFSQVEIRFGIYVSLVGSIVVALYAFLRLQQQRKREVRELFHHPEDHLPRAKATEVPAEPVSPPPPPPPPPAPEDLPLFS